MLTVKEIVPIIQNEKEICLAWNGCAIPFDKQNMIHLQVYGDLVVAQLNFCDQKYIELEIAVQVLKAKEERE